MYRKLRAQLLAISIFMTWLPSQPTLAACIENKPDLYDYMGRYGGQSSQVFFISNFVNTECKYLGRSGKLIETGGGSAGQVYYQCGEMLYLTTRNARNSMLSASNIRLISNGRVYESEVIKDNSRCPKSPFNNPDCSRYGESTWIDKTITCNPGGMNESYVSEYVIKASEKRFRIKIITSTEIKKY